MWEGRMFWSVEYVNISILSLLYKSICQKVIQYLYFIYYSKTYYINTVRLRINYLNTLFIKINYFLMVGNINNSYSYFIMKNCSLFVPNSRFMNDECALIDARRSSKTFIHAVQCTRAYSATNLAEAF